MMTKHEADALERLMNTADGRTVVNWILRLTGFYAAADSTDYLSGRRSIGGNIIAAVESIDGEVDGLTLEYLMRREASDREKQEKPDTYEYDAGL